MPLGTFCMGAIAASQGVGVHLYAASAAAEAAAIGAMGGVVAAVAAALPRVAGGYAPTLVGVILQREVAFEYTHAPVRIAPARAARSRRPHALRRPHGRRIAAAVRAGCARHGREQERTLVRKNKGRIMGERTKGEEPALNRTHRQGRSFGSSP